MNTIAALIMGAAAAALVTALLGLAIIPWLRKLHFGQTILEIGPKWHEKKQGTPTMGGLTCIHAAGFRRYRYHRRWCNARRSGSCWGS